MFFEPEFQYTAGDTGVAVLASLIGGVTVGFLVSKFYRKEFAAPSFAPKAFGATEGKAKKNFDRIPAFRRAKKVDD